MVQIMSKCSNDTGEYRIRLGNWPYLVGEVAIINCQLSIINACPAEAIRKG